MKKPNRNQFLVFAGIFALTLAGYLIYRRAKKKAQETGTGEVSGGGTSGKGTNIFSNFPIKKGSSGNMVKQLQQALVNQGAKLPKYGVDGKFGSETEAALKSLYKITSVTDQTTFDYITKTGNKAKSTSSAVPEYPINKNYADSIGLKF